MPEPVQLPAAQLESRSTGDQVWRRVRGLVRAPRWARSHLSWAFTATAATGVGYLVFILLSFGTISDMTLMPSIFTAIGIGVASLICCAPVLVVVSVAMQLPQVHRSRLRGALYGVACAVGLHETGLVIITDGASWFLIQAPIVVGTLWGSWLPDVAARQTRHDFKLPML